MTNLLNDSPLVGLAAELKRQLATKRDLVVNSPRITLQTPEPRGADPARPVLVLEHPSEGPLPFAITDHTHGQIQDHLGVGSKLYKRLLNGAPGKPAKKPQHDLLAHLVNGLLDREPTKRMLRTMDGKARAFLSASYRPRDNWDLLEQAILPALEASGRPVAFKACELTETRMYVKVVLPDFEMPVTPKVGDVIRGGLIVKNSEVGSGALGLYPYTDRLSCTNGAIHTSFGESQRHVGKRITEESWDLYSEKTLRLDDAAYFAKCRDTVAAVLNEQVFQAIVQQMRELAGIALADPKGAVEDVTKKFEFSEGESDSILNTLIVEGPTAWGLVNGITQTARDHESADRRVDLETIAGNLLADWSLAGVS